MSVGKELSEAPETNTNDRIIINNPTAIGTNISLVGLRSRFFFAFVPIATKAISTKVATLALIGG